MKVPPETTKKRNLFLKEDLPIEAVFESKFPQPCIMLLPALDYVGEDRRDHRVPDSQFRVQFKSYVFRTKSKALVKALMSCAQRKRGKIFPSLTDPTGFWRRTVGAELKIETREVLEVKNVGIIQASDIDFGALKNVDPDATVPPLVTVNTKVVEEEPVV